MARMLFALPFKSDRVMGSPLMTAAGLPKIESRESPPKLSPPCHSSRPVKERSSTEKRMLKIQKLLGFLAPEMA
jgi:hypothetical protein